MRWIISTATLMGCLYFFLDASAGENPPASSAQTDEQLLKAANLETDGPALLEFFRKRTLPDSDEQHIRKLVRQLGDDSFQARERASAALVGLGTVVVPYLEQAAHDPDIEVVRRAESCLQRIKAGSGTAVAAAAARLVGLRKPAGATEVLLAYLPFADNEIVAREVRNTLAAMGIRNGKPDPLLVAALSDKVSSRRMAAAEVLWQSGVESERPAVRLLLKDPDALVRLRIGLLLAEAKEKDSIPVLIDLLGELPQPEGWQVVDFLDRLAEDQAPAMAPGNDDASRRQCRTAWLGWWSARASAFDWAALNKEPKVLGYTMIVLLDQGSLLELGADDKPRWTIEGLQKPLDAQFLPGDKVLIAEQEANLVTERTTKGEIVWQKAIDGPLMAQRLANGHTFIANHTQFVEVDAAGKDVSSYNLGLGDGIMRAKKLDNGDIACVTTGHRYVRLDSTGKELKSFPVDVRTSGGRIEVLSNGRVVVPQFDANKVVEYDPDGKAIWEVDIEHPVAAVRLSNGNTLVTSMTQNRAVEVDRTGKEVWEYRSETRVTRAWRR